MGNILLISTISQPYRELSNYLEKDCGFNLIFSSDPETLTDEVYSTILLVLIYIDHSKSRSLELLSAIK